MTRHEDVEALQCQICRMRDRIDHLLEVISDLRDRVENSDKRLSAKGRSLGIAVNALHEIERLPLIKVYSEKIALQLVRSSALDAIRNIERVQS